MRVATAPRHRTLPHAALSSGALRDLARHDLAAAIALGQREAHRLRAEATARLLRRGWQRLTAWPRARIAGALRFSH